MEHVEKAPVLRRNEHHVEKGIGAVKLLRSLMHHRKLAWEMARREMSDLHAGQAAGIIWLVTHPLLQFAVYAFLFTVVFKVRIADRGPSDYLVYLFSGLAPWLLTQDVISRSASIMAANITIVKKVMFPVEVLVAKTLISSLCVQGIIMCCVLLYTAITRQHVPLTYALLPLLFVMHFALLWGIALLLSCLTPYFRDIPEIVRIFVMVNIYMIPVVYLPNMVPEVLQFALWINPFSYLIWCYQDVIYFEAITRPHAWFVLGIFSTFVLIIGSYTFTRLRHHLASVL